MTKAKMSDFLKTFDAELKKTDYTTVHTEIGDANHPGDILDRVLITCIDNMVEEAADWLAHGDADEPFYRHQEDLFKMVRDYCAKAVELLAKGRKEYDEARVKFDKKSGSWGVHYLFSYICGFKTKEEALAHIPIFAAQLEREAKEFIKNANA